MSDIEKYILMIFGLILSIIGIILFVKKQGQQGTNRIKLLGAEFELSAPSLVIFVVGVALIISPFVIDKQKKQSVSHPRTLVPHAPVIEINQRYTVWGEQMMQFYLEPGESKTIKGDELYANVATYPSSSCAGPGFVPYTWQIRQPYPQGGDLEIRRVLMGGKKELVGRGSVGQASMGYCGEHTFQNNGIEKIYIELRYASAADINR